MSLLALIGWTVAVTAVPMLFIERNYSKSLRKYLAESQDGWNRALDHADDCIKLANKFKEAIESITRQNDDTKLVGLLSCTGAKNCPANKHIHGCFNDRGKCNTPEEHYNVVMP